MRLRRVDLPAFGRPTRATIPKRGSWVFMGCAVSWLRGLVVCDLRDSATARLRNLLDGLPFRVARDFHPINPPAIGAIDFEAITVLRHHRSRFRNAAERCEDHSGHGFVIIAGK